MRSIEIKPHGLTFLLAVFLANLAIAQVTPPTARALLPGAPNGKTVHPNVTRHCIEEVGCQEPKLAFATAVISVARASDDPNPSAHLTDLEEIGLPSWYDRPVHRKVLPPSPEDG
jgi:hypothetical protein